ncbi:MAG: nucleophile aminohydrolase [Monoraphidium minutum]|nr:MAG: nucleophile aminohydrolase [Monoraphidium minutum]
MPTQPHSPPSAPVALQAACLLALVGCAAACSQVILGGEGMAYPTEAMSARTFDFRTQAQLSLEIVAVPKDFQLTGAPSTPEVQDFPLKTKYGIVCQVANTQTIREALAEYVDDKRVMKRYGGLCYDGINEAGLSAAYLWDTSNRGYSDVEATAPPMLSTPDPPAGLESISYFDYPMRVLAECDTIGCARALTAMLAVVNRPMLVNVSQYIVGADYVPLHASFCDKTAKCISVEWGPGGAAVVADLPHGVFTNAPPLPRQEALLAEFDQASLDTYTPAFTALDWPGGLGTTNLTLINSTQVDSTTRYIRAVRLRRLFGSSPYLDPEGDLSPARFGSNYGAFAQINALIDHQKIAGAYPGGYPSYWQGELTVVTSVRDHVNADYYLRVASNMNNHCFNVKDNTRGGRIRLRTLAEAMPQKKYKIKSKI